MSKKHNYSGKTLFDSKLEDVKKEIKCISDIDKLKKLSETEKNLLDRPGFHNAIQFRIEEIEEQHRIVKEGLIDINMFDRLVNKIPWFNADMEKQLYDKELRDAVFKRDSDACQLCKGNCGYGNLHCHHIIPNGPATMANLITLCVFCHDKVHLFLSKKGYRYAKGYSRSWW